MSYNAIRWALAQKITKSSAKFVLVAMADCVNNDQTDMTCWPSYRHLSQLTGQDVKTVEAGLRRLRESGFITDTGKRKGTTGRVIVYGLNTPVLGVIEKEANTPVFPVQYPQISHVIPPNFPVNTPKNGVRNQEGTSKEPIKEPVKDARLSEIPPNLLSDYMAVRKAKKAGPFTETAINGMEREAKKAGLTVEQAVRACTEFSWTGFNAGWYEARVKPKHNGHNGHNGHQPDTFKQRDARDARKRWEQATGSVHPDSDPDDLLRIAQ